MLDELRRLVDGLATELGRSVAIDDPKMELIVASPHYGALDQTRKDSVLYRRVDAETFAYMMKHGLRHADEVVRLHGSEKLGLLPRIALPLRDSHALYGYLWLIDAEPPVAGEELELVKGSVATITALLAQATDLADERHRDDNRVLRELFGADPVNGRQALSEARERAQLGDDIAPRLALIQLATSLPEPDTAALTAVARSLRLRQLFDRALIGIVDGDLLILSDSRRRISPSFLESVRNAAAHHGLDVAGAGSCELPADEPPGRAYRRARYAVQVARRVPSFGGCARWSELGAWQLLYGLPWTQETVEQLYPPIVALLAPQHRELAVTLLTFLDAGGDVVSTVETLHVHRTTLYYRMARIRELIGDDWRAGWARVGAHAALTLARLITDDGSSDLPASCPAPEWRREERETRSAASSPCTEPPARPAPTRTRPRRRR